MCVYNKKCRSQVTLFFFNEYPVDHLFLIVREAIFLNQFMRSPCSKSFSGLPLHLEQICTCYHGSLAGICLLLCFPFRVHFLSPPLWTLRPPYCSLAFKCVIVSGPCSRLLSRVLFPHILAWITPHLTQIPAQMSFPWKEPLPTPYDIKNQ